jgi:hypothetical protein
MARAIGGQEEDAGQGEEATERTEWRCGVKWGWRQLVGANPAVDGDVQCSGLANQGRARRGRWQCSQRCTGGRGKEQRWWSGGKKKVGGRWGCAHTLSGSSGPRDGIETREADGWGPCNSAGGGSLKF